MTKPDKLDDEVADSMICAAMRGDVLPRSELTGTMVETLLRRSQYHGVDALLDLRLSELEGYPGELQVVTHKRAVAGAVWELRHKQILGRLHAELADTGVQPIVFKGTALAYALYPEPMLRTRADTDIIVPSDNLKQVFDVLGKIGFERRISVSGDFISYEATFVFAAGKAGTHHIDLHWRINNSQLLSRLFTYDELRANSIRLPKLCPRALGLNDVYALLVACMHRAVHRQNPYYVDGVAYFSADRLIWLYDIHLLAEKLSPSHWSHFVRLAKKKQLCATCLEGIEHARDRFQTRRPSNLGDALAGSSDKERPAIYLNASRLRQHWMDFAALDNRSSQLRFLRELFFPPVDYMRSKYPEAHPGSLPLLYARRAFFGLLKRMNISGQTS